MSSRINSRTMINFTKRLCFTIFNIIAIAVIWGIYIPFDDKIPIYIPIILTCLFGLSFIGGWVFLCHRDHTNHTIAMNKHNDIINSVNPTLDMDFMRSRRK